MKRRFFFFLTIFITLLGFAADPTATKYSYNECLGSHRPYPEPMELTAIPDTLTPVYINHVGRHGARFPASNNDTRILRELLEEAQASGDIAPAGKTLLALTRYVEDYCRDRWGALDSLGLAEQRGIASRMYMQFPDLFTNTTISAISSYAPRCVMSMYEFTHQLDRLNNKVEIYTSAGRQNSRLMRPFDDNSAYRAYIDSKVWETPYEDYLATCVSASTIKKIIGGYSVRREEIDDIALAEYNFLSSLPAMGINIDLKPFFTHEEINKIWSAVNLKMYLRRSTSTLSSEPADIAADLLIDLINTTDQAVEGKNPAKVNLRFGHAETLLPLVSLLRLRGCYYLTNYFDTVGQHWCNFDIVPMSANFRIILLKNKKGTMYVRCDLNEEPIPLMPNDTRTIIPWSEARNYMMRCLPLIDQF